MRAKLLTIHKRQRQQMHTHLFPNISYFIPSLQSAKNHFDSLKTGLENIAEMVSIFVRVNLLA